MPVLTLVAAAVTFLAPDHRRHQGLQWFAADELLTFFGLMVMAHGLIGPAPR